MVRCYPSDVENSVRNSNNPYNSDARTRSGYYYPRSTYSVFTGASDGRRRQKSVGWDFPDFNSTGSNRYGYSSREQVPAYSTSGREPQGKYYYTPVENVDTHGRNSYVRRYHEYGYSDDERHYGQRVRHLWRPDVRDRRHEDMSKRNISRQERSSGSHYYKIFPQDYTHAKHREPYSFPQTRSRLEYVPRKKKTAEEESVDKVVDTCCCGCVDIVETSCCWGTKVTMCRCRDSSEEESKSDEESDETDEDTKDDSEVFSKESEEIHDKWADPVHLKETPVSKRPPVITPAVQQYEKPVTSHAKPAFQEYEEYSTDDSSEPSSESSDVKTSVYSTSDATPIRTISKTPSPLKPRKTFLREKVELEIEPEPVISDPVVFLPKQPKPPEVKKEKASRPKYIGEKPKLDTFKTAIIADIDLDDIVMVDEAGDQPRHIQETKRHTRETVMYVPEPEVLPPFIHKPQPPPPMFPLKKLPQKKAVMVRVGGGWMNVEHHRKRRIPLEIHEHHRKVTNDKYLVIKSKFTPYKQYIPVAYTQYRDKAVWDTDKQT